MRRPDAEAPPAAGVRIPAVDTLRNCEQGRLKPSGPAMGLLQIAGKHPEALLEDA